MPINNTLILREPSYILRQKCEPVSDFEEAKEIAEKLLITIKSVSKFWNRWLGFAANQIGYSKRMIVLRKSKNDYGIMVNPILIEKKFPFPYLEKCYSISGVFLVKRYLWVKVKYQDLRSNWHEKTIKGISAVYQEIDHIDGVVVSDIGIRIL